MLIFFSNAKIFTNDFRTFLRNINEKNEYCFVCFAVKNTVFYFFLSVTISLSLIEYFIFTLKTLPVFNTLIRPIYICIEKVLFRSIIKSLFFCIVFIDCIYVVYGRILTFCYNTYNMQLVFD